MCVLCRVVKWRNPLVFGYTTLTDEDGKHSEKVIRLWHSLLLLCMFCRMRFIIELLRGNSQDYLYWWQGVSCLDRSECLCQARTSEIDLWGYTEVTRINKLTSNLRVRSLWTQCRQIHDVAGQKHRSSEQKRTSTIGVINGAHISTFHSSRIV